MSLKEGLQRLAATKAAVISGEFEQKPSQVQEKPQEVKGDKLQITDPNWDGIPPFAPLRERGM